MRLFLVRHGETTWNASGKMQGDLNSPLSETGRAQAAALAPALAQIAPDHVETSTLDRTIDTARLAGFAQGVRKDDWREMNMGDWGGRQREDVAELYGEHLSEWGRGERAAPNGETLDAFCTRLDRALKALPRDKDRVLVVAHALVIKASLGVLFNIPYDQVGRIENCSITEIDWREAARPRLTKFNDVRWTL